MKNLEKSSAKQTLLSVKTKKYKMNKNQLKKIIKKNIDSKAVSNIVDNAWDSLSHLNILMELEKLFPNKITSIDGIAEANNYKDLENILISKKILLND